MGVSNEKDREQILEAAKGLAAKVVTAYRPPAHSSPTPSAHNNNNNDEDDDDKESIQGDNNQQVRLRN